MTNLGIGLGKPLAPAQVPKNSRTELQGLGEPGSHVSHGEIWPCSWESPG